jgi:hypothetical protein
MRFGAVETDLILEQKQGITHFDPTPLRHKRDQFQILDVDPTPLRLLGAFGFHCYSISPKGACLL